MAVPRTTPHRPARTGRRPGDTATRSAILAAATARFTEHGFRNATIRAIAADADVDPALVHYFFGSKEQLFVQAMALPIQLGTLIARLIEGGMDGIGARLVGAVLDVLDELGPANPMLALIRSATTHADAARMVREFIGAAVVARLAAALDVDRPELRASLCASQIVGMVVAREMVELPALRAAERPVLVAAYGSAIQNYLDMPLPGEAQ